MPLVHPPSSRTYNMFLRAFNGECFYPPPPPPIPFGLSVIQFGNLQTEILQRLWAHCHQFLFSSTDGGKTLHVSTISPPCLPLIQPSLFPPPLLFWFPRTPPSSGFLALSTCSFLHSCTLPAAPPPLTLTVWTSNIRGRCSNLTAPSIQDAADRTVDICFKNHSSHRKFDDKSSNGKQSQNALSRNTEAIIKHHHLTLCARWANKDYLYFLWPCTLTFWHIH